MENEVLELDPTFAEVQGRQTLTQDPFAQTENPGSAAITSISSGSSGIGASIVGGVATLAGPLTTKGDVFVRSTVGTRLPVGNEGESVFADPAEATGLKYRPTEFIVPVVLNLNTNTKQTLYTVPAGRSAVITRIVARSASVDLSGGVTTFLTFGFNAGANDWSPSTNFPTTDLTVAARFKVFGQENAASAGVSIVGTAAQIFGAITDAAFGSAATCVVDVYIRLF